MALDRAELLEAAAEITLVTQRAETAVKETLPANGNSPGSSAASDAVRLKELELEERRIEREERAKAAERAKKAVERDERVKGAEREEKAADRTEKAKAAERKERARKADRAQEERKMVMGAKKYGL